MATTKVTLTGPLFSGEAAQAAAEFTASLAKDIASIGQTWIKLDTERMDKSGRGGTGAASGGVELAGAGARWTISGGIRQGKYDWPWLEGVSRRNASTGFKGYGSFRRTRLRMRTQVKEYAQAKLDEYLARMGGEAV